jgi:hypothetical protein
MCNHRVAKSVWIAVIHHYLLSYSFPSRLHSHSTSNLTIVSPFLYLPKISFALKFTLADFYLPKTIM